MLLVGIKKQDDMAQIGEQLDTLPSLIRTCVACKKDLTAILFIITIKKRSRQCVNQNPWEMRKRNKP